MEKEVFKHINKNFIITLVLILIISVLVYYFFAVAMIGFKLSLKQGVLKIVEYVISVLCIIQLFGIYNALQKLLFNKDFVNKISKSIEPSNDKLLQNLSAEYVTIINGCKMVYSQSLLITTYGFIMAILGADNILFANYFILGLIVLVVSWISIRIKFKKYTSIKET